ncbi:hypothetical protein [Pseudonocardia sp. GCM10023141]|uniref:hypothetical protein n=1 Tax=Pseudonocardia sp. GCM10023141 TaxID=3252653 RepID=UPI0036121CCB
MDLRGRDGKHVNEHWSGGPTSYLGVSTHGFPNMFMILGLNGPFINLPPSIDEHVEWISDLIGKPEQLGEFGPWGSFAARDPSRRRSKATSVSATREPAARRPPAPPSN